MSPEPRKLFLVQHVPWEAPHRILDAFEGVALITAMPLDGDPLPEHEEVSGAVVMGGPMNVDDHGRHPGLATERDWIAEAIEREMPVLGVCLGAQLIARALGAEVRPAAEAEIGFAPIEISDPGDPLIGALAPSSTVLHWHGDAFDLPQGAVSLASSERTEHQAFRYGNAWGLLFHAEADAALVEAWLGIPEMAAEATSALGPEAVATLKRQAAAAEEELTARSLPGFRAFAQMVATVD